MDEETYLKLLALFTPLTKKDTRMRHYKAPMENELNKFQTRRYIHSSTPAQFVPTQALSTSFTCPLCSKEYEDSSELESHVNTMHFDIISPKKNSKMEKSNDKEIGNCPICNRSGFLSNDELSLHIDIHYMGSASTSNPSQHEKQKNRPKIMEDKELTVLRAEYGMSNKGNFSNQSLDRMEKAVFSGKMNVAEYYERKIGMNVAEKSGSDDGHSVTKDILGHVRTLSLSSRNVGSVWLCSNIRHYASTYGDKGWGCGYRNIQMLLSCLMENSIYRNQFPFEASKMPSISSIQNLIEKAWKKGFDMQGKDQLEGRLSNTRKWIGATELMAFLLSLKIRCQLVDFHRPSGPNGTYTELFKKCLEHFSKSTDFIPPLYLQHQGHSRTIVGIERLNGGELQLLVFDPSSSVAQMKQLKSVHSGASSMNFIRKNSLSMKSKQYQIVLVQGVMENDHEYLQSKVLKSVRVPR